MQIRFNISKQRRANEISDLRHAVSNYLRYAPNADLGEASPRENIRSAFYLIRSRMEGNYSFQSAIGDLERISYSMMDM